jgi:hypothetical protein
MRICNPNSTIIKWLLLPLMAVLFAGCSGGANDEGGYNPGVPADVTTNYDSVYRRALSETELSGLLEPEIQVKPAPDGNVHLAFYTRGQDLDVTALAPDHDLVANPMRFEIQHAVINPVNGQVIEQETLNPSPPQSMTTAPLAEDRGIDNCLLLGLDLTPNGEPVVVYQGGNRAEFVSGENCNPLYQGDLMVSTRFNGAWQEYLGIQGNGAQKNPMHPDATVGMAGDVAVDNDGNIHMIAQNYYEWCDQNAMNHPDLIYVRQSPADLGNYSVAWEEGIDQVNLYGNGGGIQSAMGYRCRLILDNSTPQQPIAFYAGRTSGGSLQLRTSRRVEGQWQVEVVREYIPPEYIVDFISPAVAPDGTLGVAYYLRRVEPEPEEGARGDHLCYAQRQADGTWVHTEVDYQSYCGNYCALAFDRNNLPAIVYYDEHPYTAYRERHNVKLAYWDGTEWTKELVAYHGRIGFYNTLWFDAGNVPYVGTYEIERIENSDREQHSIVFFRRDRALTR